MGLKPGRFGLKAQLFWRLWMRQKVSWVGSYLWVWWAKRASLILHQTPAKTRRRIVSGFYRGLQSGANLCKYMSSKKKRKSVCCSTLSITADARVCQVPSLFSHESGLEETRSCHKQRQTVSQSPPIKQQALPLHLMVPVSVFLLSRKH